MTTFRRRLPAGPAVVGIVNVTPDSFSDGGRAADPARAVDQALRLIDEGAAAIDLGAESTRPGAAEIPAALQWERLRPVLVALRPRCGTPLSVDTRSAEVARRALDAGADAINDVSGLRHDPALAEVVARAGASLILMHSRGVPADMTTHASYRDVVAEVREELAASIARAREAGCDEAGLVIDPGFGFAKTPSQNLELLRGMSGLLNLGCPILVGLSRKSIVGSLLARDGVARPVDQRVAGSVGLALAALSRGAALIRAHDVRETVDALTCYRAILDPMPSGPVAASGDRHGSSSGDHACPHG